MNKTTGITVAALALVGVVGGVIAVGPSGAESTNVDASKAAPIEVAQAAPAVTPAAAATSDAAAPADTQSADSSAAANDADTLERAANEAPEITRVSGQLVKSDGSPVANGVIYFVFQNRLNEIPHANPLEKVKAMAEVAAAVDSEGSFTLKMKPGNFAMVYDPAATEAPVEAGPESMTKMKKLTRDQVQARIAAIKENASKGVPIENGKLGEAYVIENRFVRPPVSDFGQLALQSPAVITVKAMSEAGEPIEFPATLRLRGKNGDIMEPHTPSVSKKATYEFHDLMPQEYQVFAIGTLPRPGAGDEITTPTVSNDQLIFTGESLSHEVVVEQPKAE